MAGIDLESLVRESGRQDLPPDARASLNALLTQEVLKSITAADVEETRRDIEFMFLDPIAKATISQTAGADLIARGLIDGKAPRRPEPGASQSVLELDEYGIVLNRGDKSRWLEKTTGFDFLKSMVANVDIIKAVILTRQRQITPFLVPEHNASPLGLRISRRDGEKTTDVDKARIRRCMEFLMHCGDVTGIERKRLRRGMLDDCVKQMLWDTLSYDACPIEITYTGRGKVSGFYNLDATTIRICTENGYEGDDNITAVQVIDGVPVSVYTHADLLYPVRNPRSDLHVGGYGYAEPEMVIRALTGYLNAIAYNSAGLDRNSMPRGMLTLTGEYSKPALDDFKRRLQAMLHGASNRWQFPIMASKTAQAGAVYTPFDNNFNEMFFARWVVYLVSVVCAVYGIDPTEIHFDSFSIRPASLNGSDTAEKLASSRDKGLVPLIAFVERTLNEILELFDPLYVLEAVGLDQEDKQIAQQRLTASSLIDELRAIDGKDPLEDPDLGNAPANPALMQLYMAKVNMRLAAEQQQQQQGEQGQDAGGAYQYGEHSPYGQNPDGGATNEPSDEDHAHTFELGDLGGRGDDRRQVAKARPATGIVRRRPIPDTFVVIRERGSR